VDIKKYIKAKIKFLESEFNMKLIEEEISHLYELKTEIAVDNYIHDLFMIKL
jgi:hypothetical protein